MQPFMPHYQIHSAAQLEDYLLSLQQSTSPYELPNIQLGIKRVLLAIKNHENIAVWGDFDVDGQTSTTILVGGLRELGAKVIYHIPIRGPESHGINLANLQKLFEQHISLLITCDTGIREFEAVDACKSAGVDVIITDHHTPGTELPAALAVISGQLLSKEHVLHDLCGAGCAYKFIEALCLSAGLPEIKDLFIDLAAIGTVADLVPLTLENRRIVRQGLKIIRENPRPSLKELLTLADISIPTFQEEDIAFQIAPRLNALGRLNDPNPIVSFFLSEDATEIRIMANRLDGLNEKRKQICDSIFRAANSELQREPARLREPVLILHHPAWPGGINGLVASQLTERYHKPAIVLTAPENQIARGSARSVEGINITAAIASQAALLNRYGGHAMAAGLSLPTSQLTLFRKGITEYISRTTNGQDLVFYSKITCQASFEDFSLPVLEKIEPFSPFGPSNPAPLFLTTSIRVEKIIHLSKEKEHLKLQCQDKAGNTLSVFWWNGEATHLPMNQDLDILYQAKVASFRGQKEVQCTLKDFRIHPDPQNEANRNEMTFFDLRGKYQSTQAIKDLLLEEDYQAWGEGLPDLASIVQTRSTLIPAKKLILVSTPYSFSQIRQVIEIVNPSEVSIISVSSPMDHLDSLIKYCAGVVKFSLQNKDGWIPYTKLEESSGQPMATIVTVFKYFQAKGFIEILDESGDAIQITSPGIEKKELIDILQNKLKALLEETRARRTYFINTPLEILKKAILEKNPIQVEDKQSRG